MIRAFTIALSFSLLVAPHASAAPLYSLTDLGTLGGSSSTGTAINNNGYAVGSSTTSGGATHAFEYSPVTHSMIDLGVVAGQTSSVANDINNSNVVVGQSGTLAFRYDSTNGIVSMGTTDAWSVNDSGEAVGYFVSGPNNANAKWNSSNVRTPLFGASPGQALSVNSSGHFVGQLTAGSGYYSDGTSNTGITLNTGLFLPEQINDLNVIAGKDGSNAAMYTVSTHQETILGKLSPADVSATAFGINGAGTIVGTSGSAGFIWTSATGMQSLTSLLAIPGWTIIGASSINDNGQILAEGLHNGVDHAVILNAVPEPSSAALLGLGVCSLMILASRRKRATARAVRVAAMALAIPSLAVATAAAAPLYTLTDLGTLGGTFSEGSSINNSGYVVGQSTTAAGATNAFVYNPSTNTISNLGVLSGETSSVATSINNSNVIVGYSGTEAFRTTLAGPLTAMNPTTGTSKAFSVNDNGESVGDFISINQNISAKWDSNGNRTTLFSGSPGQAVSVDNAGHIAGVLNNGQGYYSDGSTNLAITKNLGSFQPTQINNFDIVSGKDGTNAAFYTISTNQETILGTLSPTDASATAFAINSAGTIVGTSGSTGFIWTRATGMQSLTGLLAIPGWTIIGASSINDNGQILAEGLHNGVDHAVILSVPEPSAFVLGTIALTALAAILGRLPRYRPIE